MAIPPSTDAARSAAEFGHRIAQRRAERGLSQQQLADAVGISKNHLQLIELGLSDRAKRTPSNPQLSTLLALCRELGGRIDLTYPDGAVIVFDAGGHDAG